MSKLVGIQKAKTSHSTKIVRQPLFLWFYYDLYGKVIQHFFSG
jgi:hypothetical protein